MEVRTDWCWRISEWIVVRGEMPLEPRASWFSPKCVEAQRLTRHLGVKHCFDAGRESGTKSRQTLNTRSGLKRSRSAISPNPKIDKKIKIKINFLKNDMKIHNFQRLSYLLKNQILMWEVYIYGNNYKDKFYKIISRESKGLFGHYFLE